MDDSGTLSLDLLMSDCSDVRFKVTYKVQAMNPVDPNWIHTPIAPIPVYRIHGQVREFIYLMQGQPERINSLIDLWIDATIGGGDGGFLTRDTLILSFILNLAGIPRNSFSRDTSTTIDSVHLQHKPPDYMAIHQNVGILMAEEKDGDDIRGATNDVVSKFGWIANLIQLPFYIAIAFCRTSVRVLCFRRNLPMQILFQSGISEVEERIDFLPIAVNIARVLKYFIESELVEPLHLSMYQWHDRAGGKRIKITFQRVEIECDETDRYNCLVKFYSKCGEVSFLEKLQGSEERKRRIFLSPVGINRLPRTFLELIAAIRCILTALKGMHEFGYFHTDIRWANIVLAAANADWYWCLIDCYDVCHVKNVVMCKQRARERKRPIQVKRWSAREDILQVVNLFSILEIEQVLLADLNKDRHDYLREILHAIEGLHSLQNVEIDTLLQIHHAQHDL